MEIQVTNNNKEALKGRFAGQDYVFPPGQPVSIPEKAAEHIFGLAETNKTGALNRLGLLYPARPDRPGRSLEEALQALSKISFSEGRVVFDDSEPLPPSTGIGESHDAPRSPGGESGAGAGRTAADALSSKRKHGG